MYIIIGLKRPNSMAIFHALDVNFWLWCYILLLAFIMLWFISYIVTPMIYAAYFLGMSSLSFYYCAIISNLFINIYAFFI